jgi:hypothetical protein
MNRSYSKIRHIQEANHRLEKRLVENVITEEEEIDEANPITGMVKGLVQGGKKLMGNVAKKGPKPSSLADVPLTTGTRGYDDFVRAGASNNMAKLLGKIGSRKMDDFMSQTLSGVKNEIVVVIRDVKNLQSAMKPVQYPQKDPLSTVNGILKGDIYDALITPKGQRVVLGNVYTDLINVINRVSNIDKTVAMSPNSKKLLATLKKNLEEAIKEFDGAIIDLSIK